jgi:hypothetical protein
MVRIGLRVGRASLVGVAMILGSLALGCASNGSGSTWLRGPCPDSTNVVQRPTYEIPTTKPLYLGGYAGANYTRYPVFP